MNSIHILNKSHRNFTEENTLKICLKMLKTILSSWTIILELSGVTTDLHGHFPLDHVAQRPIQNGPEHF